MSRTRRAAVGPSVLSAALAVALLLGGTACNDADGASAPRGDTAASDAPAGSPDAPSDAEGDGDETPDGVETGDEGLTEDAPSTPDDAVEPADGGPEVDADVGPVPETLCAADGFVLPSTFDGEQTIWSPFAGVCIVSRSTRLPRPLKYHVVVVDSEAESLSYRVTPPNGDDLPRETTRQTTREFAQETGASVAINAHFFTPWPAEDDYANVLGVSVSDGIAYSPFEGRYTVGLHLGPDNAASIVRGADGTFETVPPVAVWEDAVGATEQIVTAGANTGAWEELHPRTAIGIDERGDVVMIIVDGRQPGFSEGMSTPEVADVMIADFGVVDALNLDGGGSTTLVVSDPDPRVVNSPVGYAIPGSERQNGSNLGVFADPR